MFATLLDRVDAKRIPAPMLRTRVYVERKALFREVHTRCQASAFPGFADGKELTNGSVFCSRLAIRSPHLWLMQQEVLDSCMDQLRDPQGASIATSPRLGSRPNPQWSKSCTLSQVWEDGEVEKLGAALPPAYKVRSLIFDEALVALPRPRAFVDVANLPKTHIGKCTWAGCAKRAKRANLGKFE